MVTAQNETYSITEAAKICGLNRVTLWRWIKSGRLKAHQTPTKYFRIKHVDLEEFIQKDLTFIDLERTQNDKKILVIDDDASFRKFTIRVLANYATKIEEANNGFEAGFKILKFRPSLLILDLYMPEMSGFEVCRLVKSDPNTRDIKILAITGYGSEKVETQIKEAGADAYLEKPVSRDDLIECVKELFTQTVKIKKINSD